MLPQAKRRYVRHCVSPVNERSVHGATYLSRQGDIEGLADYLVQRFDPQHDLQAQKLGQGDSLVVQIGRGDVPEEIRNAVTVGITRATDSEQGIAVTLGQQQWITPKLATHAAMIGLSAC